MSFRTILDVNAMIMFNAPMIISKLAGPAQFEQVITQPIITPSLFGENRYIWCSFVYILLTW